MYNLPHESELYNNSSIMQNFRDPYTYHPYEYNPYNSRMTLIESVIIWLGWFYGMLRLYCIFSIFNQEYERNKWLFFWNLIEKNQKIDTKNI